jgi:hypothetical protein
VHFSVSRPLALIAASIVLAMLPFYAADLAHTFHIDLVAFWCAGAAMRHGLNPYLDASLHACDVSHGLISTLTLPVAHPPYILPVFEALSMLPLPVAFIAWSIVSAGCCGLAAIALMRLTGLHWTITGAAVALTVAIPSLPLGQLVPFPFCAFCWTLVYLRERRALAASGTLAVAALLPNFAETAWLSAFVAERRIRAPLIAAGALLVLAGIAAVGITAALFYLRVVLGAYGRSELDAFWQLGTAATLHSLGVPASAALPAAYAMLAVLLVFGIYAGLQLARRFGGNHWVVATTAACGLAGAPYAHVSDVAFALPLALMLLAAAPGALTSVSAFVVAVPWQHLFQSTGIQAAICIPFLLVLAAALASEPVRAAALVTAVMLCCFFLYHAAGAAALQLDAAHAMSAAALPAGTLAEARWTEFSRLAQSALAAAIMRVPFYATMALLLSAASRQAFSAGRSR